MTLIQEAFRFWRLSPALSKLGHGQGVALKVTSNSTGTGYVDQQRVDLTERSEELDSMTIILPPILVPTTRHTDLAKLVYGPLGQCTSLRRYGRPKVKILRQA